MGVHLRGGRVQSRSEMRLRHERRLRHARRLLRPPQHKLLSCYTLCNLLWTRLPSRKVYLKVRWATRSCRLWAASTSRPVPALLARRTEEGVGGPPTQITIQRTKVAEDYRWFTNIKVISVF